MKVLLMVCVLVLHQAPAIAGQDYFMEEGCGGGFTGGSSSIRIYRDGRIFDIVRKSYDMPADERLVGKDANAAGRLFTLAESNGFLETKLDNYENWTCFITYHSPLKDHSVHCGGSCVDAPRPVMELSSEIKKLRSSLTY